MDIINQIPKGKLAYYYLNRELPILDSLKIRLSFGLQTALWHSSQWYKVNVCTLTDIQDEYIYFSGYTDSINRLANIAEIYGLIRYDIGDGFLYNGETIYKNLNHCRWTRTASSKLKLMNSYLHVKCRLYVDLNSKADDKFEFINITNANNQQHTPG